MKVWTCTMTDCYFGETVLLGVFSTRSTAEQQAQIWLTGETEGDFRLLDADDEYIYYCHGSERKYKYTAHLEEFNLNEFSY